MWTSLGFFGKLSNYKKIPGLTEKELKELPMGPDAGVQLQRHFQGYNWYFTYMNLKKGCTE